MEVYTQKIQSFESEEQNCGLLVKLQLISSIVEDIMMFKIKFDNCRIAEYTDIQVLSDNLKPVVCEIKNFSVQFDIVDEMLREGTVTPLTAAMSNTLAEISNKYFEDFRNLRYQTNIAEQTKTEDSTSRIHPEMETFASSRGFLKTYAENYKDFLQSPTTKKLRFSLQRAINLPINTLTVGSGDELLEKYEALRAVFQSKAPSGLEEQPEGVAYSKNLFAKAVLQQGETLVSSKPEMAFGLAAVVAAVCSDFPDITELLLGYFRSSCPYICPVFLEPCPGQSLEDYKKSLGYKFIDGVAEKSENYLSRTSGIARLYAAIIVAPLRSTGNSKHPHGLSNAWQLLHAVISCKPAPEHADAIATVIREVLQVAGSSMFKDNPSKFRTLCCNLSNYLTELQEIAAGGAIGRLGLILESFLKDEEFPDPDGQLPQNFW